MSNPNKYPPNRPMGSGDLIPVIQDRNPVHYSAADLATFLTGASGYSNLSAATLPNTRKAMARVRAGAGNMLVAGVGDSTMLGLGSNGTISTNGRVKALFTQMARQFTASGVPAEANSFMGSGNVTYKTFDPRITSSGWAASASIGPGGFVYAVSSAGTLSFKPDVPVDTFDIYYLHTTGGPGTSTVNVDGGAALATIDYSGATPIMSKVTVSAGTLDMHTCNIVWATNHNYVVGMHGYNSAISQVSFMNMGVSGAKAADFTPAVGGNACMVTALPIIAPDLTILGCTINDWVAGTPTADYMAAMQQTISAALQTGDCILHIAAPSQLTAAPAGNQAAIIAAVYQLAAQNNIPVVDETPRFGSWVQANALGFMFDGEHCTALGYSDEGQALSKAILGL